MRRLYIRIINNTYIEPFYPPREGILDLFLKIQLIITQLSI